MSALILNSAALSVSLESDHLVLHRHIASTEEPERETLPIKDIERVIVIGRPAISFSVLARFMDRGIPCCFLTRGGRWRGILKSGTITNGRRRRLQYAKMADAEFCLRLSKELVRSKLRNCRRAIQRLYGNRKDKPARSQSWSDLSDCLLRLDEVPDLESLRGLEGIGSFHYFRLLSVFFPEEFPFGVRSRRPPLDAANSLLSFSYTILMNECLAAIEAHSLDSNVGFMHQDNRRSPALALDLMESFRPAFCDLMVINMLNHRRFTANDFSHDEMTGGVYLSESGRTKFYPAWESMMQHHFIPLGESCQITARQAIEKQVVQLVKAIEDDYAVTFFRLA